MSLVETLHRKHLERRRRIEEAAKNPKLSERLFVRDYRPVKMYRPTPTKPRVFDPSEELAWMIAVEGYDPSPRETLTIEAIQRAVCRHFNVSRNDLLSPRRASRISLARHVGAYLARRLTRKSYPEIGRRFGGRDHTTQMHAERRIAILIETDAKLAADVEALVKLLGGDDDDIS